MMIIAYSILFLILGCGTSWVSTTNAEIELRSPTLVSYAHGPVSWKILERSCQDLGKIMVRFFTMYFNVVCIWYCLIGSLVAMHDCGTHTLTRLIMHESWSSHGSPNC